MNDILQRLISGEILLADGAMGTLLMEKGLKPGECPELFNLNRPDILKDIAESYFEAGADIIQANTFGASPLKLASFALQDRTEEINRNAVLAVKKAVQNNAYVSASVGPSGKLMEPYGDISEKEMLDNYFRQIKAIVETGVDLICLETMTDINEIKCALNAAKMLSGKIPVAACMTFDKTEKGFYTLMGVSIEQAVNELISSGADMIGSNCGNGILNMIEIAREFRGLTDYPVLIQSNAGMPDILDDKLIYPESPEFMAGHINELIDSGCNIIGGCCGTTPEYISMFRAVIDRNQKL